MSWQILIFPAKSFSGLHDKTKNMKIAITGANSSVGQNLLSHIVALDDFSAIAGVRSERAFSTLPESPSIEPRIISYDNVDEMAAILEGASCVIHLVGILIENRKKGSSYASVNVAATVAVVKAAEKANVKHIVFISVIGASADSSNAYFKSKAEAERVISESSVGSTVIRTPILLGPGTAGADALLGAALAGKVKLLGGGRYTMRPLDVDDLSRAILQCCLNHKQGAAVHELVGPDSVVYHELIARAARLMGKEVSIGTIPIWAAKLGAAITSGLKGGGISPAVIDVITANEFVEINADKDIGITLTALSATLDKLVVK